MDRLILLIDEKSTEKIFGLHFSFVQQHVKKLDVFAYFFTAYSNRYLFVYHALIR